MPTITTDRTHYVSLIEMAGELLGQTSGREVIRDGSLTHPGDPLGTVLAQAWLVDPALPTLAMLQYMRMLRETCEDGDVAAPTFDRVMSLMRFAYNPARFPGVDFDDLSRRLRSEVPPHLAGIV